MHQFDGPPPTKEEAEFIAKMDSLSNSVRERYLAALEQAIVEQVEKLLGRIPGNEEIAANGSMVWQADGGCVVLWGDTPIVKMAPIFKAEPPKYLG